MFKPQKSLASNEMRLFKTEDGTATMTSYTERGEVSKVSGDTYPVWYEYDVLGRLWKQHTYQSDPGSVEVAWGAGSVTAWVYVPGTRLIAAKIDASAVYHATEYSYNERGQLATRLWNRTVAAGGERLKTTYTSDFIGRVTQIESRRDRQNIVIFDPNNGGQPPVFDPLAMRVFRGC